jgi:hypothetical protein
MINKKVIKLFILNEVSDMFLESISKGEDFLPMDQFLEVSTKQAIIVGEITSLVRSLKEATRAVIEWEKVDIDEADEIELKGLSEFENVKKLYDGGKLEKVKELYGKVKNSSDR